VLHVVGVDLIERAVHPPLVITAEHQPVLGFRILQPVVADRAVCDRKSRQQADATRMSTLSSSSPLAWLSHFDQLRFGGRLASV
jgi:hypothetical protein